MVFSGVSESEWLTIMQNLPPFRTPAKRLVVVSPHPDDETLGAGGLIATFRQSGREVKVLAVTDGEAAYSGVSALGSVRVKEQERALNVLGVEKENIIRLSLPDGGLLPHEGLIAEQLANLTGRDDLVVAPHVHDYHPDHETCGRAARKATNSTGASLAYYFFWIWHQGTPTDLASLPLRRLDLAPKLLLLRERALTRHQSQLHWEGRQPILPAELLTPMTRPFEVFAFL
jgi:LmbE family N-acetylglucosaminyl deacetylase